MQLCDEQEDRNLLTIVRGNEHGLVVFPVNEGVVTETKRDLGDRSRWSRCHHDR